MANLFKLTKDNRGRWRRQNLGLKQGDGGRLAPATFFLGPDYEEACKRVVLLEQMWEAVQKGWLEAGPPAWDEHTYPLALAVARGEKEIAVEPHFSHDQGMQADYLADLREQFPFLDLRFSDAKAQENAERVAALEEEEAKKLLERKRTDRRR